MGVFDVEIPPSCIEFFQQVIKNYVSIVDLNAQLKEVCGCEDFFSSQEEIIQFQKLLQTIPDDCAAENRAEYGDYQTNAKLAKGIVALVSQEVTPDIIIEPTCGKGNFIVASLDAFPNISEVIGIEIHEPYVWQCKFNILNHYLQNPVVSKPKIRIIHKNVFQFDFATIKTENKKTLVIGNPPWVTNSALGAMDSSNLPEKKNFKHHSGIEAITGKGNFDIAEYITTLLLKKFSSQKGYIALLLKNSVIKNLLYEQKRYNFRIGKLSEYQIDSRKEFSVSVGASLFCCKMGIDPEYQCKEIDFYSGKEQNKFGWANEKFYHNISFQDKIPNIDGKSQYVWRQGVKHDCSNVMELTKGDNLYINKLDEITPLEEELVYGILKSSDLKNNIIQDCCKYTIITQKRIGQDTSTIQDYPLTWNYLQSHKEAFTSRKSSIYKGKPDFSIFGIGDYAFEPYKVAISGLYKTFHFSLVIPKTRKPLMLDDTCYYLSFSKLENAIITWCLLNSEIVRDFLEAVSFPDAKRMINKELLMRMDLVRVAELVSEKEIQLAASIVAGEIGVSVEIDLTAYKKQLNNKGGEQYVLF
jgi:tRNA1(Val) A37 N6-methylase TrmN6